MAERFNIKEGLTKALKTALRNEKFIATVFDMLLGRKEAAMEVEYELKSAAQENTLNEVVAVHRFYKQTLKENAIGDLVEKPKELMQQLVRIRKKSARFQREVLVRTLKKPGMLTCFLYIVKALCTPGYVLDDLLATPQATKFIRALIETAIEVAGEQNGIQEPEKEEVDMIAESFDPNAPKVSLFVGRFQPFTRGHVKCLKELRKEFKAPVIICAILVSEEDADKEHPFYGPLQDEMYERLKAGLNDEFEGLLAENGVIYVKKAYIGELVAEVKKLGYQPVGWGCGTDRYEIITPRKRPPKEGQSPFVRTGYLPQTEKYIEQQSALDPEERDIDTDPENGFKIHHIQRDITGQGDDPVSKISGTKVREALKNGDIAAFNSMMPICLHPMFNAFRKAVMVIDGQEEAEPAYQTSGAINEDDEYFAYRKRLDEAIEKLVNKGKK